MVAAWMPIVSFGDKSTEDIFNGVDSKQARKIPKSVWRAAARKLDMVNAAHDVMDLKVPPGNKLEKLKGDLKDKYSIRINDQFRVVFGFANGNASDVRVTDYH